MVKIKQSTLNYFFNFLYSAGEKQRSAYFFYFSHLAQEGSNKLYTVYKGKTNEKASEVIKNKSNIVENDKLIFFFNTIIYAKGVNWNFSLTRETLPNGAKLIAGVLGGYKIVLVQNV